VAARIDIIPSPVRVIAGSRVTFHADVRDRYGNTAPGAVAWAVTGSIGTIDSGGRFTASATIGSGTVTARIGTETGIAEVEIVPGALATLSATPSRITVIAGAAVTIRVDGYDDLGNGISG